MLAGEFSLYLGKDNRLGYTDFIAEDTFYCILEIDEGYSKEEGKVLLSQLKEKSKKPIENLYAFEFFLSNSIKQANVPAHFSLAAMLRKGDVIYLKTVGLGQVFLSREGEFAKIIDSDNSASGQLKASDSFILTTARFTRLVGSEKQFKTLFSSGDIQQHVEDLQSQLEGQDDNGIIALFVSFRSPESQASVSSSSQEIEQKEPSVSQEMKRPFFLSNIARSFASLRNATQSPLRRLLTLAAVAIIFIILIWSVVLGYQRRSQSELYKKITASTQIIDHKLSQAEDVAAVNVANAVALIDQAKVELNNLKKEANGKNAKEISDLEKKIQQAEAAITKKENKEYSEFFDLTVDDKNASGDKIYLDKDTAVILDKKRAVLYTLSLTQKSLDSILVSGAKQATLVGKNQAGLLLYIPSAGVYVIDQDGKSKKVINNDLDWGKITDMKLYAGNIYLLDSNKSEVYKYLAVDTGYSSKSSYLKGQTVDLEESNSLAIDASVYIGFSDGLLKFTAGIADDFKTTFPDKTVNITRIYTDEDLQKVYAWDKSKGVIYVLGKSGVYERQIKSAVLSQATDFIVRDSKAYILSGPKIYTVSVE